MNLKRIGSRKSLKFLGLLISSLLIATVSATTFRYLYIDGSITVGTQQMSWILGSDASGASISGTTAIVNFYCKLQCRRRNTSKLHRSPLPKEH